MPTPVAVTEFLAQFDRKKHLVLSGAVPTFESDPTELTLDARGAATTLANEEWDYDEAKHVALGFVVDLPLFVDASKKALPVYVLADGAPERVAASLAAFVKRVKTEPRPRPTKKPLPPLEGPTTIPGKVPAAWPPGKALIFRPGSEGADFLRFDVRANRDVYYSHIREGRAVGVKWKHETVKYDRGTGKWLDVSQLDMTPYGFVTARVKDSIENLQKKGLEFLPLVGDVEGKKGQIFLMNVTLQVPCLDADELAAQRLVLRSGSVPTEPCFFRPTEHVDVVLATGAMVEALRSCGYSGLSFVPLEKWT